MNKKEKTQVRIDVSTRATIAALEGAKERNPGKCITKPDLFPNIARRAGWIMQDEDNPIYDEEAIGPPDNKFLHRYWKNIKFNAARRYKKYIIPSTDGFRLGTLDEWCQLTTRNDMPIVAGIARSSVKRSKIAKIQGASSPIIQGEIKQLGSGE